jgi:large subunit ribosomal protein L9
MQVILLERVGRLGGIGDEVRVRDGFARNFLLPQGKALRATDENRARFERERGALEQLNADRREAAAGRAGTLEGARFVLLRQAGESGQLYGSVTARDIAEAAVKEGHDVGRGQVSLDQAIKSVGLYPVKIRLHAEVAATVTINVARTPDEAERQARGENVITTQAEEDRAVANAQAVELFEAGAEPKLEDESVPNSESSGDAA